MKKDFRILFSAFIFFGLSVIQLNAAETETYPGVAWSYSGNTGPSAWATLSPDFALCSNGTSQSPIDINTHEMLPAEQNPLQINYSTAPLNIVEDGLTTLQIPGKTIQINDGHTIQLDFLADSSKETIRIGDTEFKLVQLHFHTPAENQINGKIYPAEIHFVHQGPNGRLAVIGVFIKPGNNNPLISRILANLPKTKGTVQEVKDAAINPAELLPQNKLFYSFLGSLTTPPCAENVTWMVMANPIEASASQIQKLRYAIAEDNARPVQPLNNRRIISVTVQ